MLTLLQAEEVSRNKNQNNEGTKFFLNKDAKVEIIKIEQGKEKKFINGKKNYK